MLGNDDAKAIRDWILRLEREQAVLLNQTAPANKQKSGQRMKQHLDSKTIRIASYVYRESLAARSSGHARFVGRDEGYSIGKERVTQTDDVSGT